MTDRDKAAVLVGLIFFIVAVGSYLSARTDGALWFFVGVVGVSLIFDGVSK